MPGLALCVGIAAGVVLTACDRTALPSSTAPIASPVSASPPPATMTPAASDDVATLVGAGDIAVCGSDRDEATAALLDEIPGTVFTLGDNVYGGARAEHFRECYGPSWGRHRARTRPVAGNHDYDPGDASAYLEYFGVAAAPEGVTWYAYEVGSWQVIALDSDCEAVGGCDAGSPQERWLVETLAGSDARCTVALWHHPLFSSGAHGNDGRTQAFWRALDAAGAEIVLTGHDHNYERFAVQDAEGRPTDEGLRQFVVGTGGVALRDFARTAHNSEVRDASTHGVLALTLRDDGYDWRFVPVAGGTFTDSGTGRCR